MGSERVKVVFISGAGRSGTTLLDRILGHLEGFFSLGEVYYIWDRGLIKNQLCGCGKPFAECDVWRAIIAEAFGNAGNIDLRQVLEVRQRVRRLKYLPQLVFPSLGSRGYREQMEAYKDILNRLYTAIHHVSGAEVLVDSSKLPLYAFFLGQLPVVELYVIHLVRDSRAVAYSWKRKKRRPEIYWETVYIPELTVYQSARVWTFSNMLSDLARRVAVRSIRVRYEDLAIRPQQTITHIMSTLGFDSSLSKAIFRDSKFRMGVNHTVAGNPVRFKQGELAIRPDEEWRASLPRRDRLTVTALTWPLLFHYGYFKRG